MSLCFEVPDLLVGFDVESTGLDTQNDEAISYGFAVFRRGVLVSSEEFFVLPEVEIHPGAERVHGVSMAKLRRMRREGEALSTLAGAVRAVSRLRDFSSSGATFVGANPMFDYRILDATLRRYSAAGLSESGFDLSSVTIIDVVAHDRLIDSDTVRRSRRGLTYLCEHYGIAPGRHHAAEDARAACEVLISQVKVLNDALSSATQTGGVPPSHEGLLMRLARSVRRGALGGSTH